MALAGTNTLVIPDENAITLVDTDTGKVRRTLPAETGLKSVAASADGQWVAASNWESGDVTVWGRHGTNQIHIALHAAAWLAFSPDNQWLATATRTECHLWRVGDWKPGWVLHRKRSGVGPAPVAFAPDGSILAWATADDQVGFTALPGTRSFLSLPAPGQAPISLLQFTPDGGGLLVMVEDGSFTIWDLGAVQHAIWAYGLPCDTPRKLLHWAHGPGSAPVHAVANLDKIEHTQQARQDLREREKAVHSDPNNFTAWREMASINSSFFRFNAAVDAYDQALRLNPEDVSCAGEAGYALIQLHRPQEAEERFEQVLAHDARNLNACQQLAYLYLHALATEGTLQAGRRYAERAFEIDPHNAGSLFWRGVAEYRSGRFEQALNLIDQALAANPSSLSYGFYRAMCLGRLGETAKARETLALALDRLESNGRSLVEHREHFQSFIDDAFRTCSASK